MTASKKPKSMMAGHPDNFQTPGDAIAPLLQYLPKEIKNIHGSGSRPTIIWEPSCGKGNLVRAFGRFGYEVIGTDILLGDDFLETAAPHCDYIITNPPFSIKHKFLSRCYQLGKPFALLMPLTTFDSAERQKLFHRRGIEVLFMPKRVHFETPSTKGAGAWFMTAWFTWGFQLPNQLTFSGFDDAPTFAEVA